MLARNGSLLHWIHTKQILMGLCSKTYGGTFRKSLETAICCGLGDVSCKKGSPLCLWMWFSKIVIQGRFWVGDKGSKTWRNAAFLCWSYSKRHNVLFKPFLELFLLSCGSTRQLRCPCLSPKSKAFFSYCSLDGVCSSRHNVFCYVGYFIHWVIKLTHIHSQKK